MTWHRNDSSGGNVGGLNLTRVYKKGASYEAGQMLIDQGTGTIHVQNEDGAFDYPSREILSPDKFTLISELEPIETEIPVVGATTDTGIQVRTTDSQDYEIDWGDGAGWEDAPHVTLVNHTYSPAYTGVVKLRFKPGSFPRYLSLPASDGWQLDHEMFKSLNRYNTMEEMYCYTQNAYEPIEVSKLAYEGTKIARLNLTLVSCSWKASDMAKLQDLKYLFLSGGALATGTIDLDASTSTIAEQVYINGSTLTMNGDVAAYINRNPNMFYLIIIQTLGSIRVKSVPVFVNSVAIIDLRNLTEIEVDRMLEAGASAEWRPGSTLTLNVGSEPPSAAGAAFIPIIEALPNAPTITVAS